jgi:lipid II:glycine glycyltransferase (peptidoglycan interpeptide bridge formation enzyme)
MGIIEVLEKNRDEYNRFVLNSETGSFLQSYEWGEWQKNLGRKVYRFFLTDNNNNLASIQLVKMPLPFGKFYLYVPYGPVIGSGRLEVGDWKVFLNKIKQNFPKAVFIRLEPKDHPTPMDIGAPLLEKEGKKSANIQPAKTLVINLEQQEDQLLAQMHHKTRYNIRLAEKHGVEIQKDLVITPGHGLYFKEVVEQIADTEKRQEFVGHGAEYYKKFLNFFGLQNQNSAIKVTVYKALFQKQLLVSAIMVDYGKTRTYLFGGSSFENKNLMAPYLLHFQAMLDAKVKGFKVYDFWGTETSSGKTAGFVRFKLGFGGTEVCYAGAYDFSINKIQYKLYQALRKLKQLI